MPLVMLLMLAFPSCAIIEINGWGNDYKDLTESQKALVRPLEDIFAAALSAPFHQ